MLWKGRGWNYHERWKGISDFIYMLLLQDFFASPDSDSGDATARSSRHAAIKGNDAAAAATHRVNHTWKIHSKILHQPWSWKWNASCCFDYREGSCGVAGRSHTSVEAALFIWSGEWVTEFNERCLHNCTFYFIGCRVKTFSNFYPNHWRARHSEGKTFGGQKKLLLLSTTYVSTTAVRQTIGLIQLKMAILFPLLVHVQFHVLKLNLTFVILGSTVLKEMT